MSKQRIPLYLNDGIWFEDIDYLIPWGTPIIELKNMLSPQINKQPNSIHITWENRTCFHIPCNVTACQLFDEINPRAYHIFLDTLHYASFKIRDIKTYHPEDTANEFKRIFNYLCGQLGNPAFSYPKYFEALPCIFWEFQSILVSYTATGRNSFSLSVKHDPDGYNDIKDEAHKIRLREGKGARVDYVAW